MAALNDWNITDANNNAAPPDGWPENTMQYSEVNNTGRAVQGTMRRFWGDVNGSLQAAGAVNAYTVSLNESGYTSYFAGMYFACEIPITNTGAVTIDVNGIGAQNVVARDGSALPAGILDAGGIYEFRYDGTNFQLMGTIGGDVSISQGTFTNSNQIDLVDTDVALRVGATDPDTAQHMEMDLDGIQSKSDATTAAAMSINPVGGNVEIGAQSGTGDVRLYDDAILRLQTSSNGQLLLRNNSNADPTVPDPFAAEYQFRSQDGNEYGFIGYPSSTSLRLQNRAHGGSISLRVETTAGVGINKAVFNEDNIQFFGDDAGNEGFRVLANTVRVFADVTVATPPTTETPTAGYDIVDADTTDFLMRSGFFGSNEYRLVNNMNGGLISIRGEDSANAEQLMAVFDPDGQSILYYNGILRLETRVSGTAAIRSDGNTDAENRFLEFRHADGTLRGFVGHGGNDSLRLENQIHGGNIVLDAEDSGGNGTLIFVGDPDGAVDIYHPDANFVHIQTRAEGANISRNSTDTRLYLQLAGSDTGWIRATTTEVELRSLTHGGLVVLYGEDTGGTNRALVVGDPDAGVTLYVAGTATFEASSIGAVRVKSNTTSSTSSIAMNLTASNNIIQGTFQFEASNTLEVENQRTNGELHLRANDGGVIRSYVLVDPQLDQIRFQFNNNERFRINDTGVNDVGVAGQIADSENNLRPIGFNVAVPDEEDNPVTINTQARVGRYIHKDQLTPTYTVDQETDVAVGSMWLIANEAGGNITLAPASGVTIRWFDGAGGSVTSVTFGGSFTLGTGAIVTLYKYADIEYHIWGSGIS